MGTSVGLVAESKDGERRVALDPPAVASVIGSGARVLVQAGAGEGSGIGDEEYAAAGAELVADAADVWSCDVVVKVKEPQPEEFAHFREGLRLFCYLHLAAEPRLTRALQDGGVEAHAFETVTDRSGLPLLAPMSEVAGRAAAIVGASELAHGNGTLLGGAAGVPPARVLVIGLGVAGEMAARGCRGMDAEVTGVDVDLQRLRRAHDDGWVTATLASSPHAVAEAVAGADLVVGAALVPGARAPVVVTEEAVASMRAGSVVIDLAIDQGGCVATSRPTSHSEPTFTEHGVLHYCVTNVPGRYPRTASRALSAAVAPYLGLLVRDPGSERLSGSLNVAEGRVVHPAVERALAA